MNELPRGFKCAILFLFIPIVLNTEHKSLDSLYDFEDVKSIVYMLLKQSIFFFFPFVMANRFSKKLLLPIGLISLYAIGRIALTSDVSVFTRFIHGLLTCVLMLKLISYVHIYFLLKNSFPKFQQVWAFLTYPTLCYQVKYTLIKPNYFKAIFNFGTGLLVFYYSLLLF